MKLLLAVTLALNPIWTVHIDTVTPANVATFEELIRKQNTLRRDLAGPVPFWEISTSEGLAEGQ